MTQTVEERIRRMLEDTIVGQLRLPVRRVDFFTEWNGYDVYEYHLHFDEPPCIGTL